MGIRDLSDKQLDALIANYERLGENKGGIYSRSEALIERSRRSPGKWNVRDVAAAIINLSKISTDGKVSYNQIWQNFLPDRPWSGNASQQVVGRSLGQVIGYCAANRLPVLTVLVVRQDTRKLSDEAVRNIYNEARNYGINTGLDPVAFVRSQEALAATVLSEGLPDFE
jgi:hypothetical protein